MALNFNLFKTPNHRMFNYRPLYYDERKEALNEKIEKAQKREMGDYTPGDMVKGAFKRGRFEPRRSKGHESARRIITLVTLVAIMVALIYIAQYMGLLF